MTSCVVDNDTGQHAHWGMQLRKVVWPRVQGCKQCSRLRLMNSPIKIRWIGLEPMGEMSGGERQQATGWGTHCNWY